MAHQVIMPKQGLQMTEGYISAWRKKEGDQVAAGEPLFEMETDKLHIVIDSPVAGTLLKIVHPEGDTVPITQTIAYIGVLGESVKDHAGENANGSSMPGNIREKAPEPASGEGIFATPRARTKAQERGVTLSVVTGSGPDGLIIERDVLKQQHPGQALASPLAKKIAELSGTNLSDIKGTGDHGKIMADDVRRYHDKGQSKARGETPVSDKGMRHKPGLKMDSGFHSRAYASLCIAVDMSVCVRIRKERGQSGKNVSVHDFIIMAASRALRDPPKVNVSHARNEIWPAKGIHIGLSVSTENGPVVPAITYADERTLNDIALVTACLAQRAMGGKLNPDEMNGSAFTVADFGMYGVDSYTADCRETETAVLASGAVKKRAVVMPDGTIAARDMLWLSLSYDPLAIDADEAARFLHRVSRFLENPILML